MSGGGGATQAGIGFQDQVAAWAAAHMLAGAPLTRWNLSHTRIAAVTNEAAGELIDDVVLDLEGGGRVWMTCKRGLHRDLRLDHAL